MCTVGSKIFTDKLISFKNLDIEEIEEAQSPVIDRDNDIPVFMFPRTGNKPGTVLGFTKYFQIFGLDAHVPQFDKKFQSRNEIQHNSHAVGKAIYETLRGSENFNEGAINLKIWFQKFSVSSPDMLIISGIDRWGKPRIGAMEYDPTQKKSWVHEIRDSGYIARSNHFLIHQSGSSENEDPDSYERYRTAEESLEKATHLNDFMEILRSHNDGLGGQYSICRHKQKTDKSSPRYLTGKYHTILSVISEYHFSASELFIHYTIGNPCKTSYITEKFD